jgi:hypothetical protein
LIVT